MYEDYRGIIVRFSLAKAQNYDQPSFVLRVKDFPKRFHSKEVAWLRDSFNGANLSIAASLLLGQRFSEDAC